eukprot:4004238-Pleurochrysis_carterae.AAC.1
MGSYYSERGLPRAEAIVRARVDDRALRVGLAHRPSAQRKEPRRAVTGSMRYIVFVFLISNG